MKKTNQVTIYDIANQLNVSSATVSRALSMAPVVNKETRKKVLDLAKRLGYRSNHRAKKRWNPKSTTIGVITRELNSSFIQAVLAGIEKVTANAGFDILIAHSAESYEKEVANANNLFRKRINGLIASLSADTKNLDHFRPFTESGIPVIFFDRAEQNNDNPVVIIDNYKCGYLATRHLIEQGCKRIVHVTSNLNRNVYADRYRGYRKALSDNNILFDKGLLLIGDLSEGSAITTAHNIIAMYPRPDGAFVTNDFVAVACMRTLKKHFIRIPEDIAIVGFNDDAIGKLVEPALSTIHYPGLEIGEVAATNLINRINGFSEIRQIDTIIISAELIVRESSLKKR